MFCVSNAFLSFRCSSVVICWERTVLLARLYVVSVCVIVTFPMWCPGSLGQVWYLIVLIPDIGLMTYFHFFSDGLLASTAPTYMKKKTVTI